jgi:hypothetical protein
MVGGGGLGMAEGAPAWKVTAREDTGVSQFRLVRTEFGGTLRAGVAQGRSLGSGGRHSRHNHNIPSLYLQTWILFRFPLTPASSTR